jgi:hypothetical protein
MQHTFRTTLQKSEDMDIRNDVKNTHCTEVSLLSIVTETVIYTSE